MSLGGLATHLANIPNWGTTILDDPSFDLASAPPNQEAKAIARRSPDGLRRRHQGRAREAWTRPTPSTSRTGSLKRGGQEMFTMPRAAAFRTFVLYHLVHHRGQLSVVPAPQRRACAGHLRAVGRRRVTQHTCDRAIRSASLARERSSHDALQLGQSRGTSRAFRRRSGATSTSITTRGSSRDCHWQPEPWTRPTIIALHGLNGSSDAHYMRGIAAKAFARGMNVVRLNQRNCGDTEHLSAGLFHSGPDRRRRARHRGADRGRRPARDRRRRAIRSAATSRSSWPPSTATLRRRRARRRRRRVADHRDRRVREGARTAGQPRSTSGIS